MERAFLINRWTACEHTSSGSIQSLHRKSAGWIVQNTISIRRFPVFSSFIFLQLSSRTFLLSASVFFSISRIKQTAQLLFYEFRMESFPEDRYPRSGGGQELPDSKCQSTRQPAADFAGRVVWICSVPAFSDRQPMCHPDRQQNFLLHTAPRAIQED